MTDMTARFGTALPGVWTHDEVERRLQAAITTLRRMPMPANGMPGGAGACWPDYTHDLADRANWIVGADTPEYLRRNEDERNRTRLSVTVEQIRDLDECLKWLRLIRDGHRTRRCSVGRAPGRNGSILMGQDGLRSLFPGHASGLLPSVSGSAAPAGRAGARRQWR